MCQAVCRKSSSSERRFFSQVTLQKLTAYQAAFFIIHSGMILCPPVHSSHEKWEPSYVSSVSLFGAVPWRPGQQWNHHRQMATYKFVPRRTFCLARGTAKELSWPLSHCSRKEIVVWLICHVRQIDTQQTMTGNANWYQKATLSIY